MRSKLKSITDSLRSVFTCFLPKGRGLETEVAACLSVMETLETQVVDSAAKGNKATDQLSASFGDMASQARGVVQLATESTQADEKAGVDEIRGVLSELLTQVRQTSQSTQQTAERLTAVECDLQDVEQCIAQIEDVANRSRMVSLNGQIEAARAQEFGDGFAVVASETGDLAQNVSDTSHKIREVVDRMAKSLRRTVDDTKRLIEEDQEAIASCEQRVEGMLTSLQGYQSHLESNIEITKQSSDQLAKSISQAVMTLQFQDAVSQRMHHVSETIQEIREIFTGYVGTSLSGAAEKRRQQWIEKLSASYCVDDERLVLSGQTAADLEQSHSSNVELF